MQSYAAIIDSVDTISNDAGNHGRPVSSSSSLKSIDGVSQKSMSAMHLNATYGMQMLDAALRHVRGESPSVSGSGLSPGSTTSTMGIGPGIHTPPTKSVTSSSLAGAVTSSQEAAVPTTVPPLSSANNTSPKVDKEVVGIRVIEDGAMKKPESKENGPKSGDRKRQVGRFFLCC